MPICKNVIFEDNMKSMRTTLSIASKWIFFEFLAFALLCFFSLYSPSNQLFSQTNYDFRVYDNKDGFTTPDNHFVCADSKGYVWSCGPDGLTRFDGKTFINYNKANGLNDSHVECVLEDADGNLFCGTRKGISIFNREVFKTIKMVSFLGKELKNQHVTCLYKTISNGIYAGTYNGVFKYNAKLNTFFQLDYLKNSVYRINGDDFGRLFLYTEKGFFILENQKFTETKLKDEKREYNITNLSQITQNYFWVGTDDGIFKVKKEGTQFKILSRQNSRQIESILRITKNRFLFSEITGNLILSENKKFQFIDLNKLFAHVQLKSATEDYQGNIWLATTLGLIKMFKSDVVKSEYYALVNDIVASVVCGENNIVYFGTLNGLVEVDEGKTRNYTIFQHGSDDFISALRYQNNQLYIGTFSGKVFILKNGLLKLVFEFKKVGGCIYRIIVLGEDELWISFFNEIVHIEDSRLKIYKISNQFTQDILLDKQGKLWFANMTRFGYIEKGKIEYIKTNMQKYDNFVTLSLDKRGAIWIGTYGGGILNYSKGRVTQYSMKEGLTNNFVSSSFYEAESDVLWVGTMYGISKIQLNNSSKPTSITNYLNGEFIESYGCVQNAICKLKNGSILVSVGEDLFEFPEKKYESKQGKLNFALPELKVNGMDIKSVQSSTLSIFKSHQNNFEFTFSAIDYHSLYFIKYSWKLQGNDKTWEPYTERKLATYTNLASGEYVLFVKAKNQNGQISEMLTYKFFLESPFYLKWWFIVLEVVVLFFIGLPL